MERPEMAKRVNEMAAAYRQSQVLFSAVDADVFALLTEERTAAEVARKAGWDERGARMLLDALLALELVEKSGERYRNAEIADACLAPTSPAYQGNIVKHNKACLQAWLHLDEALRRGTGAGEEHEERSPEELRNFILGMSDIGKMSAQEVLEKVDLSPYRHVLDVGGGPASYSIAFLRANPEMHATLFDQPDVIPIAREQVRNAGLEDRFDFIAGDVTEGGIGEGYDLIFVSNLIHSFGPEMNRTLVKRYYDAMRPGGLLIIKDFLVDPGRTGPPFGLMFALHMFVNTAEGDTYSVTQLEEWTKEAGFGEGRFVDIAANSRLWLAPKPKG